MKNWDVHGYSNTTCNAFVEPEPDAASTEAKQNLERWLFYFDRYNNHELSAKLDKALLERTEERVSEIQETSRLSWIEVSRQIWVTIHENDVASHRINNVCTN
jgi:ariadne-1